jgi:DNA replication protein DnaC
LMDFPTLADMYEPEERAIMLEAARESNEARLREIIPQRFHGATAGDLPDGLSGWTGGHGILFYGPPGVGKTHSLAAAVRKLVEGGHVYPRDIAWHSVSRMFSSMRNGFNNKAIKIPDLSTKRVVVLDDWGKERSSDWVREQTFEIIDDMYSRGGILLASANVSNPNELYPHVGEYVFDRLKDMIKSYPMMGESRRGKQ